MTFTRRHFLKSAAARSFAAAAAASGCAWQRKKRPNIIFLTADTTRFDRMGFNGYRRNPTTPFLDSLAAEGVNFTRCYSQATCTFPSVASFMSSKHPHTLGLDGNLGKHDYVADDSAMLADILRGLGYTTVGASSVLWLGSRNGLNKGFDHFSFKSEGDTCHRDSGSTLADAKRMLAKVAPGSDLFLWFHSFDPHLPYNRENRFGNTPLETTPDATSNGVLLAAAPPGIPVCSGNTVLLGREPGFGTAEQVAALNQLYDAQIAYMDRVFQELLEHLRTTGFYQADRDVLILNADHGELMGEHGFCSVHGKLWDEVTHVPLIMKGAGLPRGSQVGQLAANIDILPTILELAAPDEAESLSRSHSFEGTSLLPAILTRKPVRARATTDMPCNIAICSFDGRYKLITRRACDYSTTDAPKPLHGHTLSGPVYYEDSHGRFPFAVPQAVFEKNDELQLQLTIRSRVFGNALKAQGTLSRPEFELVTCHTRHDWDTFFVPWGPREWKYVLTGQQGRVAYDSETEHGWVPFEPMKSRHYDLEIYDLLKDPNETENIAAEIPSDLVREWLERMLSEFEEHTGRAFRNPVLERDEMKQFSDEELESIEDLGYL